MRQAAPPVILTRLLFADNDRLKKANNRFYLLQSILVLDSPEDTSNYTVYRHRLLCLRAI